MFFTQKEQQKQQHLKKPQQKLAIQIKRHFCYIHIVKTILKTARKSPQKPRVAYNHQKQKKITEIYR